MHPDVHPKAISLWGKRPLSRAAISLRKPNPNNDMNTTQAKGDWNVIKGKLKQKWANITDDDLMNLEGKTEEALGRIQKRTGATREAIQNAMDQCEDDCGCR